MFNLIILSTDWKIGRGSLPIARMFEYTADWIADTFQEKKSPLVDRLATLPCLFMNEGTGDEIAFVGQISGPRVSNGEISFECSFDTNVPPIKNRFIYDNQQALDMPHDFEFSRNHWAVKNVDLYRFLLHNLRTRRQRPTVFQLPEHESIQPNLVSAMMPFHVTMNPVYESIRQSAKNAGFLCARADDIWQNPSIIQDVVSLIDRSRIEVCDCSGRNSNVFYEAGIAHTLGREVILISQSDLDVPFDLRHLRYIPYLNNAQGRSELVDALQSRMQTIGGH